MDLGFSSGIGATEKVKVASLVSLLDVLHDQFAVAARKLRWGRTPLGAAFGELFCAQGDVDALGSHIESDDVAGADQCQWTANPTLRRHMQHAGSVAGA